MSTLSMESVGQRLREIRQKAGYTLRKAALLVDVDVAILSKMERGERWFNKKIIIKLTDLYLVDPENLLVQFFGERVLYDLKDEVLGAKALEMAEKSIQYGKLSRPELSEVTIKSVPVFKADSRIDKTWVFGSFARQDQRPGSDLDIMIKINSGAKYTLFDFAEIQFQLENILGLKVDIVEEDALSPLVRESVIAERILIYER